MGGFEPPLYNNWHLQTSSKPSQPPTNLNLDLIVKSYIACWKVCSTTQPWKWKESYQKINFGLSFITIISHLYSTVLLQAMVCCKNSITLLLECKRQVKQVSAADFGNKLSLWTYATQSILGCWPRPGPVTNGNPRIWEELSICKSKGYWPWHGALNIICFFLFAFF